MKRTCHAKATGLAAETKGRQGVHPTPAEHQVPHLPRKSHRQSALAEHQVPHLPRLSHAERRTPGRTSDPLQSTKCRTCHAKATGRAAETKGRPAYIRPLAEHQVPRLPRKSHRRPRDARAYIRPLAEHQVPCVSRKSHRQSGGDQGTPGRTSTPCRAPDQGTPGRTSDPLQSTKCHACHAKESVSE